MHTILYVQGWRFLFYSDEGNEPMHMHAVKDDAEQVLASGSFRYR